METKIEIIDNSREVNQVTLEYVKTVHSTYEFMLGVWKEYRAFELTQSELHAILEAGYDVCVVDPEDVDTIVMYTPKDAQKGLILIDEGDFYIVNKHWFDFSNDEE